MKSTRKAISLILAFAFLISCTIAATAINADNYKDSNGQRPLRVLIQMHNDGYREYLSTLDEYNYETYIEWIGLYAIREYLENGGTLTGYFNSLNDADKAKTIVLFFSLFNGGPPSEYLAQFMEYLAEEPDLFAEMFWLEIQSTEQSEDDENENNVSYTVDEIKEMMISDFAEYSTYDRTMDFKEYLSRLIAYFGNGQELENAPTVVGSRGWGDRCVGMGFYEMLRYIYGIDELYGSEDEDSDESESVDITEVDTMYVLMGSFTCAKQDYVTFLLAVYDFMYPEITPTTTTTTKIVTTITNRFRDMTNIARATNVTNVTGVTNVTAVTNVSATNVTLPY